MQEIHVLILIFHVKVVEIANQVFRIKAAVHGTAACVRRCPVVDVRLTCMYAPCPYLGLYVARTRTVVIYHVSLKRFETANSFVVLNDNLKTNNHKTRFSTFSVLNF